MCAQEALGRSLLKRDAWSCCAGRASEHSLLAKEQVIILSPVIGHHFDPAAHRMPTVDADVFALYFLSVG